MKLVEIWKSTHLATKKEKLTADRIAKDLVERGVVAEVRHEASTVSVWRDTKFEKRLRKKYD